MLWQERGREDKAAEAWGKVLVADPKSAEALVALTLYYSRLDRMDTAREYLARLKEGMERAHENRDGLQPASASALGYKSAPSSTSG